MQSENRAALSATRVVARMFLGLAVLLAALYGLAWVGELWPKSPLVAYLPKLGSLPGFATADTLANAKLSEEQVAVLSHLDSLASTLIDDPVEPAPVDSVEQPPVVPQLPEGIPCIELEYDKTQVTPLRAFYDKLYAGKAKRGQIRILHFGDSQIEGDRITSYLRSRLQREFGGQGVGLVSIVPSVYPPYGLTLSPSSGWVTHSLMPAASRKKNERYGMVGSVCRFSQRRHDDSLGEILEGTIAIRRKLSAGRGMRFSHCRVFARCDSSLLHVAVRYGDSIAQTASVGGTPVVEDIVLPLLPDREDFTLQFLSETPASVYGFSLESLTGVQVDNIPLRGSSGTDFTAMDSTTLVEMFAHLAPSLVLLQFGVNVVPGKVDGYDFYTYGLAKQINYLKKFLPGVPIVLIGVSDMGEKVGEYFRSYENLPKVQAAQRRAAQKTKIAYWDCRRAMGGENSIVAWVQANPPLATADYVHFSPKGARYVGEMLYASLMADYAAYVKSIE